MKNSPLPVIIQARTGSTRLPGKMLKPFYGKQTIPELIVAELREHLPDAELVLATSINPNDDALVAMAESLGIKTFRGSEDNVLQRFISCADHFGFHAFLRVCADNPFLCGKYAAFLATHFPHRDFDYLSFVLEDGTPVIRSHFGFFCEGVTLSALKKAASMSNDKFYTEHVTNFIYANSDHFNVIFTPVPTVLKGRRDIRLTIDTAADFEDVAMLYSKYRDSGLPLTAESICKFLEQFPEQRHRMEATIKDTNK